MKKFFSLAAMILTAACVMAQKPTITFEKTTHDFGKINEIDGRVTTEFSFKNEGAAALVLSEVRASCGCTTPKWTREPVEPGQTGTITVTYNPNGRPGRFQKTITVTSNADPSVSKLYIKGEVIPKSATPVDNFPVKIGSMSLKNSDVDFGEVVKNDNVQRTIEYANQTKDTLKVEVVSDNENFYAQANLAEKVATILPNTKGEITIMLFAKESKDFGMTNANLYLVINGKMIQETPVTVKAELKEDFSMLTEEQIQAAPIADIQKEINLGTMQSGKKQKVQFHIANAGQSVMAVRRIENNNKTLTLNAPKTVKSGKKGTIKVEMQPMEKGNYTSDITILTNDPKNSRQTVTLRWTIE